MTEIPADQRHFFERLYHTLYGESINKHKGSFAVFVINALYFSISLFFICYDYFTDYLEQSYFNAGTLLLVFLNIQAMSGLILLRARPVLSAFLTCVIPATIFFILPATVLETKIGLLLSVNPFIFLALLITPYLVFSTYSQFKLFLTSHIFLFLSFTGGEWVMIHDEIDYHNPIAIFLRHEYIFILMVKITIWQFFFWSFYNLSRKNELYQRNMEQAHAELDEQHQLILKQKEEIAINNLELASLNEHLEDLVQERTLALELQNTKLAEYAYINSHLLRAPLCRLKGLKQLLKSDQDPAQQIIYLNHLDMSVDEFDQIIMSITNILNGEDPEKLRDIQDRVKRLYYTEQSA